ncbi:MAG: glycosyltransferase family 4 protein [Beijerinckiaceae bacterium]
MNARWTIAPDQGRAAQRSDGLPGIFELLSNRLDNPPVVYLVNQYPAITHTFIRREIMALEEQGFDIVRTAVRAGANLVDPQDLAELDRTTHLMRQPHKLAVATLWTALTRPRTFIRAAILMVKAAKRSDRSFVHHLVYLAEACRLARVIRRTGAKHIHAHFGTNPAEVAMLAASLTGASYSFTVHGYDEYDKPEFLALHLKINRALFVACVSHYGRAQLLRWCRHEDQSKIHLVRCGLPHVSLPSDEVMSKETVSKPVRFVCVARLCREKAQETLLEAAAVLLNRGRRFELVLVGDGDIRQALEKRTADLGLKDHVRFAGWLGGDDVRREMLAARALVVPSFAENLPVVMMEAMALERPVIATMIAGIPELVIPGETGWLVPASSVEDLANAMEACLDCPDPMLKKLGRQGRARVQQFHDVSREAARLAALFP